MSSAQRRILGGPASVAFQGRRQDGGTTGRSRYVGALVLFWSFAGALVGGCQLIPVRGKKME